MAAPHRAADAPAGPAPAATPRGRRRWPRPSREFTTGALLGVVGWAVAVQLGAAMILDVGRFQGVFLFAALGGALALTRLRALVPAAVALVVTIALVVALTPITVRPVRAWVRDDPLPPHPVDAVVVLSSAVSGDGLMNPDGLQRFLVGMRLVREGVAPRMVVSRIVPQPGDTLHASDRDQRRLATLLPAPVPILAVWPVRDSHDEAVRVAALARREGWDTLAVVTSPLHTRRACAAFERAGVRVVCVASEERLFAIGRLESAQDRLRAFAEWLYERLGWIKYRALGWV